MEKVSVRILTVLATIVVALVAGFFGRYMGIYSPRTVDQSVAGTIQNGLPILAWIDPIKVGYVRDINIVKGQVHHMRTLSMRPALFEIEDFLSPEECEDIIFMAQTQGLESSRTLIDGVLGLNESSFSSMLQDPDASFEKADTNEDGILDKPEIAMGISHVGDIFLNEKDLDDLIYGFSSLLVCSAFIFCRVLTCIRYIGVDFTFVLPDCVRYNEDSVKSRISDLDLDKNKDGFLSRSEYTDLLNEGKLQQIVNYTSAIKKNSPRKRNRLSNTAFLDPLEHVGHKVLFDNLRQRIQDVTGLQKEIIWTSEHLQVIRYDKDGHYHCHYDSEEEIKHPNITCCHYFSHLDDDNCLPCRYLTFFFYLNEPEEGGETAFPIADNDTDAAERMRREEQYRCDLSNYCHKAKIRYKPKRGAALFWYNHNRDEETGWLGELDKMSFHGGCDVIKGTKWAANSWINVGKDRELDMEAWESYKEFVEYYEELEVKENKGESGSGTEKEQETRVESTQQVMGTGSKVVQNIDEGEKKNDKKETGSGLGNEGEMNRLGACSEKDENGGDNSAMRSSGESKENQYEKEELAVEKTEGEASDRFY